MNKPIIMHFWFDGQLCHVWQVAPKFKTLRQHVAVEFFSIEGIFSRGVGWSKEIEKSREIMITAAKKNVSAQNTQKDGYSCWERALFFYVVLILLYRICPWKGYICDRGKSNCCRKEKVSNTQWTHYNLRIHKQHYRVEQITAWHAVLILLYTTLRQINFSKINDKPMNRECGE